MFRFTHSITVTQPYFQKVEMIIAEPLCLAHPLSCYAMGSSFTADFPLGVFPMKAVEWEFVLGGWHTQGYCCGGDPMGLMS